MIYRLEKLLSENKSKLSEEHIKKAQSAISSAEACFKKEIVDLQDIQQEYNQMNQVSQDLSAAIYSASKTDGESNSKFDSSAKKDKADNKSEDKDNKEGVIDVDGKPA